MNSPRGVQLMCQIERIQRISNNIPRRIGLSATLSDYESAEAWLCLGSGKECITPNVQEEKKDIGLFMQRFKLMGDEDKENLDTGRAAHYKFLYESSLHKKALIFAKSRSEIEMAIANIRKIALEMKTEDVYRVHHGSISATLRQIAEKK